MAGLRFTDAQARPTEFLDLTSVPLDEFQHLVRPSRPRSTPRWRRGGSMGHPGPLADLRWTSTAHCRRRKIGCSSCSPISRPLRSQSCRGVYSGWSRDKANPWIPVLLPALLAALRTLGDAPARSLTALAQRLGIPEAAVAGLVVPSAAETSPSDPPAAVPDPAPL